MKIDKEIGQKKFRSAHQKAVVNVLFTGSWLQLRIKEFMKPYGITAQQFNVLKILKGQNKQPVSTNLIRERMLDKMSDVSRIISRLLDKKLVEVSKCVNDKRLVDIVISQKGLKLLEEIDARNKDMDNMMGELTAEEADLLSNLLDKLRG